ncbi:MAG: phosphatase PAP2 family protein [Armatimonadota bacterium]|nr:MAG: phosphatase PAP2 family protein [Armatimonadota bacterium]
MLEALSQIDISLFYAANHAHHPLLDAVMLFVTDIQRTGILLLIVWVGLLWKGGTKGRTVALLLLPLILLTDQLSSHVLKELFGRVRPCEALQGVRAIDGCRHSLSFPSSHAVNTFAAATLFSLFYRRWVPWVAYGLAAIVSYSRIYLGLHYPSDVFGGAVIGATCALVLVWTYGGLVSLVNRRSKRHDKQ